MKTLRTRWAAIGAAVAVTLGAGGVSLGQAALGSGDRPVFVAVTPCRLVDTRPGDGNIGGRTSPLGANDTLTLQVTGSTGQCSGIPAGATAAALNVTAIRGTTRSYLTLYPADAPLPNASNLNWNGGDPPTPNKVDVKLSPTGAVKITNNAGTVHVAADLVGYYTDHTHDDRYYTKGELDTRIRQTLDTQPWSVHIDPTGLEPNRRSDPSPLIAVTSSGVIGMAFDPDSTTRAYFGFRLPPSYDSGVDLAIDMFWTPDNQTFGAPTIPCNTLWAVQSPTVVRSDGSTLDVHATWALPTLPSGDSSLLPANAVNFEKGIVERARMVLEGTELAPGDMVTLFIRRRGGETEDTCKGVLVSGLLIQPID